MKKIIISAVVLLFVVGGCSKKKNPLDITPDGRLTLQDIFSNDKRTEAYLNTVYSAIPSYFYSYFWATFLSVVTDESYDGMQGSMADNWTNGGLTVTNNPLEQSAEPGAKANHYATFWGGIRDANVFIQNIDNSAISSAAIKSRMKAEAQLLRAFFYWELIKKYGGLPIVTKPFENGFDFTKLTRPTFQQCVDFIVGECNTVIANNDMPMRLVQEQDRGRFTKAVAYAIKSEALLYNASPLWNSSNDVSKWKAASTASREALVALTAGGQYSLAPDYNDYFINHTDINSSPRDRETIYERTAINGTGDLTIQMGFPSRPGTGKNGCSPSQELVDSYEMQATGQLPVLGYSDENHLQPIFNPASGYDEKNPYVGRDPRFYATIFYNGAKVDNINGVVTTLQTYVGGTDQLLKGSRVLTNTKSGYYLRKFIDPKVQAGQPTQVRWKKYRLAEIILNFAEAENESNGPTNEVYDAINVIRRRVQMPDLPAGLTQDQIREKIRHERRVELAIEEHRFWDVRRWKILDKTDKVVTGMEITKNPDGSFNYNRFVVEKRATGWQDKYRILPLPIQDVSSIPDFSKNQNPGW